MKGREGDVWSVWRKGRFKGSVVGWAELGEDESTWSTEAKVRVKNLEQSQTQEAKVQSSERPQPFAF